MKKGPGSEPSLTNILYQHLVVLRWMQTMVGDKWLSMATSPQAKPLAGLRVKASFSGWEEIPKWKKPKDAFADTAHTSSLSGSIEVWRE